MSSQQEDFLANASRRGLDVNQPVVEAVESDDDDDAKEDDNDAEEDLEYSSGEEEEEDVHVERKIRIIKNGVVGVMLKMKALLNNDTAVFEKTVKRTIFALKRIIIAQQQQQQ